MTFTEIKHRSSKQSTSFVADAMQRVLAARGVSAADLDYSIKNLLPPRGLSHIQDAALLLAEAVIADARIVVVGDFDADGATSCALAVRSLRSFGLRNVSYLVPNRFEFGYGLSPEIVGVAATREPDLLITVDNGISSVEGVYAAQALGISVLITDHHLPGDEIPTADVIVNPNLPGDKFQSKNLAGVGVIFYVMLALRAELRRMEWFTQNDIAEPNMSQFLDLVALGTVADVVTLDRNNRLLVQQGLQRIRAGQACPGINALLSVAKRLPDKVTASDLGFAIGPRLNAAGRLDDMSVGIECLLCDDQDSALALALQLDDLNRERRTVEQSMQDEALAIVEQIVVDSDDLPCVYILHEESWHQGVVGLVASRIKERTQRPVIALAPADQPGEWKGSARSIEGLHIRDLLARVDSLYPKVMSKFGGHAMAAGMSVATDKLNEFVAAVQTVATQMTADRDWNHVLWTDGELSETEITLEFAEQLRTATPWGQGFPEPLFDGVFKVTEARQVGELHAKLQVQPVGSTQIIDAICFGYFNQYPSLPDGEVRAAYRLDVNEWQGRTSIQLIIQHIELRS